MGTTMTTVTNQTAGEAQEVCGGDGRAVSHAGTTGRQRFSVDDCEWMHAQDRKAAAAVIGVMTTIFLIAVALYSSIAICVVREW